MGGAAGHAPDREPRDPAPGAGTDPAPDDPDALLARYGAALADAVEAAIGPWVIRAVQSRLPAGAGPAPWPRMEEAARAATDEVGPWLHELLALDVDRQWTNPLSVIRGAVAHPTRILADLGVAPVARDGTDERLAPDDVYDLAPAAFADLGPEVHEAGLAWGAAKAHAHLTRHRAGSRSGGGHGH